MATGDQRDHILAVQQWLIAHRSQIGYVKLRPMATAGLYEQDLATALRLHPDQKVISPDCSETVEMICRFAGLKPPSGPSFPYAGGLGNSTSMWNYLPHYDDPKGARVGAIVAYGVNGGQHVAMVMEPDGTANPWLFSHGSPDGPIKVRYNDMLAALGNPPVALLDPSRL